MLFTDKINIFNKTNKNEKFTYSWYSWAIDALVVLTVGQSVIS